MVQHRSEGLRHSRREPQDRRGRSDHRRGCGARQTGNQAIAAHEERDHHLLHYFLLADDHAAHLRHDLFLNMAEAVCSRP